jgi:ribonuclease P/MRP protein subunit POP3
MRARHPPPTSIAFRPCLHVHRCFFFLPAALTLFSLLEPLGRHRKTHRIPSKGKKRKRDSETQSLTPPDPPPVASHVLVGLNNTTRYLASLARQSAPSSWSVEAQPSINSLKPLSFIAIPHPSPLSSLLHAHLPTLVHLSSLTFPSRPQTRLVLLPSSSESRLARALHIPRVGALGILEDTPGSDALAEFVREHVGEVQVKWIDEAKQGEWKGSKVSLS